MNRTALLLLWPSLVFIAVGLGGILLSSGDSRTESDVGGSAWVALGAIGMIGLGFIAWLRRNDPPRPKRERKPYVDPALKGD